MEINITYFNPIQDKTETLMTEVTTQENSLATLMDGFLSDRDEANNHVLTLQTQTGWGDSDTLSGYLSTEPSIEKQLSEALKMCRRRAVAMRKVDTPRVLVTFMPNRSCTDGKRIFIASEVFDEATYSYHQKLDVVLGLTTHEMAHVLYTDFYYVREAAKISKVMKQIQNVIEDERIERMVSVEMAGFSRYLRSCKRYYFDFLYNQKEVQEVGATGKAFDVFFKMVRYPSNLTEQDVEGVMETAMKVKSILTPYPSSNREVYQASVAIFNLLKDIANSQAKDDDQGDGEGILDKLAAAIGGRLETGIESQPTHGDSQEEAANGSEDEEGSAEVDAQGGQEEQVSAALGNNVLAGQVEGSIEVLLQPFVHLGTGQQQPVVFVTPEGDRVAYEAHKRNVKTQAAQLARVLKMERFQSHVCNTGLREGQLDENKLVDALAGIETVHYKKHHTLQKPLCVVLAVDQSGSMGGHGKIEKAAEVSVLFMEALRGLPSVELFIYGFTSDAGDPTRCHEISIFHEPGTKNHAALGSMAATACNADGICLRAIANRVRKRSNADGLFFVVSDGRPASNAYSRTDEGIVDTRAAVNEISAKRFMPIQIGIQVDEQTQAQMFDDYVNYEGAAAMVNSIGKLLRKKMSTASKR